MPVVFVQVGQAGNQIGGELWKIIKKEFSRHHNLYFNRGKARCIAVDSEPKVVRHLLEEHGDIMRESNVMFEQAGRGNNWAYGFFDIAGRTHKTDSISSPSASHIGDTEPIWRDGDTSLLGRVMGAFHKEVEACDMYHGCVVIHSLAGGTGSGLGSRIVSAIRDEYPHGYVLSIVVSPFEGGEVTLFHYNALLALSTLQTDSDGIILMHNEGRYNQSQISSRILLLFTHHLHYLLVCKLQASSSPKSPRTAGPAIPCRSLNSTTMWPTV
eukprot:TRINITY_DN6438_c0_g1_i6.p1 TRINITY_DN6438_c0_g1~~TRINITY_DN6438_c0_g1_i6.p1  ORF type:complete len:269 (+),score=28.71 TRINITY_DN6438_c0_g1_i6:32-838(+)